MRTEQAQQRLFLAVESDITGADDTQMPRPKILDRSPVEILVDDRRADI
jgi:hypothetical protein